MPNPLHIVVCAGIVPDPLQTLEPITGPSGPGLKNEMVLPAVLDPAILHSKATLELVLAPIWDHASPDPNEKRNVLRVVEEGWEKLKLWQDRQFPHLESFMKESRQASDYNERN